MPSVIANFGCRLDLASFVLEAAFSFPRASCPPGFPAAAIPPFADRLFPPDHSGIHLLAPPPLPPSRENCKGRELGASASLDFLGWPLRKYVGPPARLQVELPFGQFRGRRLWELGQAHRGTPAWPSIWHSRVNTWKTSGAEVQPCEGWVDAVGQVCRWAGLATALEMGSYLSAWAYVTPRKPFW